VCLSVNLSAFLHVCFTGGEYSQGNNREVRDEGFYGPSWLHSIRVKLLFLCAPLTFWRIRGRLLMLHKRNRQSHTHAHTHTLIHTRTHSHAHTHTHTHAHTHTHKHIRYFSYPVLQLKLNEPQFVNNNSLCLRCKGIRIWKIILDWFVERKFSHVYACSHFNINMDTSAGIQLWWLILNNYIYIYTYIQYLYGIELSLWM
jgi:hypothetical protein